MINENNKKVPCGGFYLGDGLTMDGDTLKSLGGEQVQSDYTQNDPTAKDYIKNRPGGYEEGFEITWDGDTTGRVSATGEGMPFTWYKVSDEILTADQIVGSKLTTVESGESIQDVILNDDVHEVEFGIMVYEFVIIATKQGTFNILGESISIPEFGIYFTNFGGTGYISSLSSIIAHPFDDKYIPDTIARKDEVYTKNEIYTNYSHTMSITWDGNTDGKDTFAWNGFRYYKISDDVPVFKRIQSVSTSESDSSMRWGELLEGENCYRAGLSIVVTKAGVCQLAPYEGGTTQQFTASSTGIYFRSNNAGVYQTSLELTSFIEQDGIIVNSANKKWKITVDDNGAISATEIPE